jgi:hypothetical protein
VVKRSRERPARLAEKLLQIRQVLCLSQSEMLSQIGKGESGHRNFTSDYERGVCLPPLLELVAYARTAGVSVEALIDDDLDLPARLPRCPKR